ncbi:MAG TPA: transcriptional regulator [Candidatus Angelobacter sp.]|nr:transcriptional regulator [Candidatus Angelobacter sp.]
MRCRICVVSTVFFAMLLCATSAPAQQWQSVGPEGGTVRSLAFDPRNPDRIFLGTSAGRIYLSTDNGSSWSRFAHLGSSSEMVLDHIVIDPINSKNIYVSAWNAQLPDSDGEIFRSRDGGKTWDIMADMHGKSVRALALAPSDPRTLIAGALDGIYRSRDGGDNWERISPERHAEIKNVESVAVDPLNPQVIYAGTWHLPWKTEDGGKSWHNIKKGVIDDSDVFSIAIDSLNPASVYISACSGIYRSESAGELFRKIQGIPYAARRTRILRMDSMDHKTVYAGTTEGLWKTSDGGATWKRTTSDRVIVNDVLIDPRKPERVLLATDRGGVLASNDGGLTFTASNRGFTHRQVASLLLDPNRPNEILAGILNDKEFGGVFASRDGGQTWTQMSEGLEGRDVFVLRRAPDNTLVAGTDTGVFERKATEPKWSPVNRVVEEKTVPVPGKRNALTTKTVVSTLTAHISALEISGQTWYAASSQGMFISTDAGAMWSPKTLPTLKYVISLALSGNMAVAASRNAIAVSVNGGETWLSPKPMAPDFLINSVAVDPTGTIWLATRDGMFRSSDLGDTWKRVISLRLSNIAAVQIDADNQRILATGAASTNVYESTDNGRSWTPINTGWLLRNVGSAHGRLMATTPFDGIVVQPETAAVQQAASASGTR